MNPLHSTPNITDADPRVQEPSIAIKMVPKSKLAIRCIEGNTNGEAHLMERKMSAINKKRKYFHSSLDNVSKDVGSLLSGVRSPLLRCV